MALSYEATFRPTVTYQPISLSFTESWVGEKVGFPCFRKSRGHKQAIHGEESPGPLG